MINPRLWRVWWAVLVFAVVTGGQRASAATTPPLEATRRGLSKIVHADFTANRLQSVAFGAWTGTSPLLVSALGQSLAGVNATPAMHIRPGIVETEALDTILVKLVDQGRARLDMPLAKCFPALPRAADVTLRMLGNNRSGYGDYLTQAAFIDRFDDPFTTFSADELIAIGTKHNQPSKPGTSFFYSHTNAVLLGAALRCITGKPVAELIAEMIVRPLGLTQTSIPDSADMPAPVQHVFHRDRGVFEDATYWNPSWASYSGSIVSTIQDVATMQRTFGSGRLVSKRGLAEILAPTNANEPTQSKSFYFGLGVIVANTWMLQHAQVAGSDVVMGYLPERDLTIVVSTAIGFHTKPVGKGYSLLFFKDAAAYLAPERPVPARFTTR